MLRNGSGFRKPSLIWSYPRLVRAKETKSPNLLPPPLASVSHMFERSKEKEKNQGCHQAKTIHTHWKLSHITCGIHKLWKPLDTQDIDTIFFFLSFLMELWFQKATLSHEAPGVAPSSRLHLPNQSWFRGRKNPPVTSWSKTLIMDHTQQRGGFTKRGGGRRRVAPEIPRKERSSSSSARGTTTWHIAHHCGEKFTQK